MISIIIDQFSFYIDAAVVVMVTRNTQNVSSLFVLLVIPDVIINVYAIITHLNIVDNN